MCGGEVCVCRGEEVWGCGCVCVCGEEVWECGCVCVCGEEVWGCGCVCVGGRCVCVCVCVCVCIITDTLYAPLTMSLLNVESAAFSAAALVENVTKA